MWYNCAFTPCQHKQRLGGYAITAREVFRAAEGLREPGVRVRPPAPCAISRIGDYHRVALDMLAAGAAPLQRVLTALRNMGLVKSDARTAVDVDPIALL